MSQFKPGDPGILLTNIGPVPAGTVIELISSWPAGTKMNLVGGIKANCAEDSWIFCGSSIPAPGLAFAPERLIMPLQGNFQPEQQKSREVVE